jgi:hypothetical protein
MAKKSFRFEQGDKEYFKDVVFLVEASSHEQHQFWRDHHYKPSQDYKVIKTWKQESGYMIQLGKVDKRPICVTITYDIIDGRRVLFYEGCSELVDHKMIKDWLRHWTEKTVRWDNGTRWAICDSSNFHHCLEAIEEMNKK